MIPTLYDSYRHWTEKGSVYILSDTHFGDSDCYLMDKNWVSPEEQVKIINKYATKNDTLVLLGDIGDISYLKDLRAGYKVLIMGNHDETVTKFRPYFDEIYEGPVFIADRILLSHEPIEGLEFCLNIHGHDHSGKQDRYHLNLAANICGYTPINLGTEIKKGLLGGIKDIHRIAIDKAKGE